MQSATAHPSAVPTFPSRTQQILESLRQSGQLKHLQTIEGPMDATVKLKGYGEVACFCSNNYLGLADDPRLVAAATAAPFLALVSACWRLAEHQTDSSLRAPSEPGPLRGKAR